MAVVFSDESPKELYGRVGMQGADWRRSYTRMWQVITDDPTDGPRTVREALPVGLGMAYSVSATEFDNGAFVNSIACRCTSDDGLQWEAVVEYGPYQPLEHPQSPLDEQPQISWSWAEFQRPANQDVDGKPILNKAGDTYTKPFMIDDPRPVLQLSRNEASFDQTYADQYRNKVNSTSFFGGDPGVVKVHSITASRVLHPDIGYYWQVSYEFHFHADGWHEFAIENGFNALEWTPGSPLGIIEPTIKQKYKIKDDKGSEISSPWPLDDIGQRVPKGGTAAITEWVLYEETDFSVFGFDGFYASLTGT